MLKNYVIIALRNLQKHAGYTLINVLGLAVGMACCLLIALYVTDELSYDRFHEHTDRLYRVLFDFSTRDTPRGDSWTQGILAPTIREEIPEILHTARLRPTDMVLRHADRQFQETAIYYADSTFFELFTFPLVQGHPRAALQAPNSIVLTATLARKYFGDENPIGQTLLADNETSLTVTGVLADVPRTSHLQFDALVSMATIEEGGPWWVWDNWKAMNFQTYALLPAEHSVPEVEARLQVMLERHAGGEMRSEDGWTNIALSLEPLRDIYLKSSRGGPGPRGSLTNLYVFSIVAVFILVLACINFVNLTTARATERAREVGVRKAIGAERRSLMAQFLIESVLLSSVATLLALLLAEMALPVFHVLAGKPLSGAVLLRPVVVLGLFGCGILVGLAAGSYPAFYLSRFRPVMVLKGKAHSTIQGTGLRKALVVAQLGTSIMLIAGTLVVYTQLGYMQNQRLGFDKDNRLILHFGGDETVLHQLDALKQQLMDHPNVTGVTASSTVPGQSVPNAGGNLEDRNGISQQVGVQLYTVDHDFLDVYDMTVVAGRDFSRDVPSDAEEALILNETAVRRFGYRSPEDALGRRGRFWERDAVVVGVVRDFHHFALHRPVEPLALRIHRDRDELSLRLRTDDVQTTLAELEALWTQLVPHRPFDFTFLDASYDRQYRTEVRFGQLLGIFASLAILVGCLGLFGLATFSAEQRTKEIGIRKVLGASAPSLVLLLSKDFAKLVGVAFVIAAPAAYVAMNRWLDHFAYRMDLDAAPFLLAGTLAFTIALTTVSYQAIRAATANPVEALRYE